MNHEMIAQRIYTSTLEQLNNFSDEWRKGLMTVEEFADDLLNARSDEEIIEEEATGFTKDNYIEEIEGKLCAWLNENELQLFWIEAGAITQQVIAATEADALNIYAKEAGYESYQELETEHGPVDSIKTQF